MADERRKGALYVLAAATLWSLGGLGVKIAVAEPLVIAGMRCVFALVFMVAVLVVSLRRSGEDPSLFAALLRRPLVWAAAVSYAVCVILFVLAARRTTAANAIFLQYTANVYVALLAGPVLGEKLTRRDGFAVAACIAGMALTFGGELGGGRWAGNLLAIGSSFGFAALPLFLRLDQKRLPPKIAGHAPLVAMTLGNAIGALVTLPAMIAHPVTDARTWPVLIGLGMFQIGLPYVLYAAAVKRLRALETSLIATVEPVLNPIWVLLATGETPSALAIAGGGMILVAAVAQGISAPRRAAS